MVVKIGNVHINVPAPNGFYEVSSLSPETRKMAESFTPPQNRLLGIFVSEKDLGSIKKDGLPEFNRYMMLQVNRALEGKKLSKGQFEKLTATVKTQHDELYSQVKDKIDSMLEGAASDLSKDFDLSFKMKLGQQIPMGVFQEKADALSLANLGKYSGEIEGIKFDYLSAGGMSLVLTRNKILFAYVFSNFEIGDDINWVKSISIDWTDSIKRANK